MYFQVNFSPMSKDSKLSKKGNKMKEVEEEIHILSLAPFTPTPKVFFEDVPINTESTKKLHIKNPTKNNLEIYLSKIPPPDRLVHFNWIEAMVPGDEEVILEILWSPKQEGAWRDNLIIDGKNAVIKKSIPITFKSKAPKKIPKRGNNKIAPAKKTKSPIKTKVITKRKVSPVKKLVQFKSPKNYVPTKHTDENILKKFNSRSPLKPNIPIPSITINEDRRVTYNINNKENFKYRLNELENNFVMDKSNQLNLSNNFDDSLELSPDSPRNKICKLMDRNVEYTFLKDSTPNRKYKFSPSMSSTVVKSNISPTNDATFDKVNVSTETYIKVNDSTETYLLGNISGETYIKTNLSADTYVKDTSIGNIASLHDVAYTDNFKKLENITEELSIQLDSSKLSLRSRKSDISYNTKRQSLSNLNKPKTDWNQKPLHKVKFANGLNLKEFIDKSNVYVKPKEKSVILHNPDSFLNAPPNPYILTSVNDIDPFMSATLYYDSRWIDEQEIRFKKLLNALLTPPEELDVNSERHPVDVAKLWQECKKLEVLKAPTNEEVSIKHVSKRLNSLRQISINLFRSPEIYTVLSKCVTMIENNKLVIRKDKDVHLDLGLQYEIMSLFLSYNPLWLRIGLETIFGMTIPLNSNCDIIGLSSFILKNVFKDNYLLKKYKNVYSEKYTLEIKKHVLKKFFMFVYFMDKAKLKKIIPYDPCLFCKNAPIKESKEILIRFTREVVSAVGDITKFLRTLGYELLYKQLYIHEFEYAIENLGVDLRDGIRLTRVMEIILLQDNLLKLLRVPTISRLQKIHNVKIVFESLTKAGCSIVHDIAPKDIVEGHKEKTLSFLWQVIYKFQGPRFTKAVISIQNWWRSLIIIVKRRILNKERERKLAAVIKIQKWYRKQKLSQQLEHFASLLRLYLLNLKQNRAATKIQAKFRMYKQRCQYATVYNSIIILQKYTRKWLVRFNFHQKLSAAIKIQATFRGFQCRKQFLTLKSAVVKVEEKYLATKLMHKELEYYENLKASVLCIQRRFRANKLMRIETIKYNQIRLKIIYIQQKYRANIAMIKNRFSYLSLKRAVIFVEMCYTSYKLRQNYLKLKRTTIMIQNKFRANNLMKLERNNYLIKRNACIIIQRKFRAWLLMKKVCNEYLNLKKHAIIIQMKFKANKSMIQQKTSYNELRNATITIQRRFRANQLMHAKRNEYLNILKIIIWIQTKFRSKCATLHDRITYLRKRNIILNVQRIFRTRCILKHLTIKEKVLFIEKICIKNELNNSPSRYAFFLLMQLDYNKFLLKKQAALTIQKQFRANKAKNEYQQLKQATIKIQRWYKGIILMKKTRKDYKTKLESALVIQRKFRATLIMRIERKAFIKLKCTVNYVQNKYIACKLMQECRSNYITLKQTVLIIEERYKAKISMRNAMGSYNLLKKSVIIIQNRFRANLAMKKEQQYYTELKEAVITIQRRYRAKKLMEKHQQNYIQLRKAVINIQKRFHANQLMLQAKLHYQLLLRSIVLIQRAFKSYKMMKIENQYYVNLKLSVITIQRRYRANKLMQQTCNDYQLLKKNAILIQRRYRALVLMKKQKEEYLKIQKACITIQHRYKAKKLMEEERNNFIKLKNAVKFIQAKYRAKKAMLKCRTHYKLIIKSLLIIQIRFRSYNLMQKERKHYLHLKQSTIVIQRKFRANKLMQIELNYYKKLRQSVIIIQRRYRDKCLMRKQMNEYVALRNASVVIQRRFRANILMIVQRKKYVSVRNAAVVIQRRYRALVLMRRERDSYKIKLRAVLYLQTFIRGYFARMEFNKLMDPVLVEQRKKDKMRKNSATKIQAIWRGYYTRRSNETHTIKEIRERIVVATKNNNPHNTLAHRKDQALKIFLNETSTVSQIIQALMDIEYVTRRHKSSCLNMSEKLAQFIILIILSPGRSLPNSEACTIAASCLINFAKYKLSLKFSWFPEHIEGILSTMKVFCDKECLLFSYLCTLVWIYAHNDEYLDVIMSIPNLKQKMLRMHTMCERKQKMCQKSGYKIQMSVFKSYSDLPMPLSTPDWGLEYDNKPRTFTNSMHGLKCLMDKLKI